MGKSRETAHLVASYSAAVRQALKDKRFVSAYEADYDCFYASVFEAENPALKSLPLAVQQKHIIVTCNYEARRRGLHKLQLISEAKKLCPDVVIVLGEDLTRFRNASRQLYNFIRQFSWNNKIERLGFDEVFLDVTDIIRYNVELLNANDLTNSFFCLSQNDPTLGFPYNAAELAGHAYPASTACRTIADSNELDNLLLRLHLGSHLAQHLRAQLEEHKGYTATVGISTSKLLSKLVGNLNKPNGQTTLSPPYETSEGTTGNATAFIDGHEIGKIPGIGFKLAQRLREHILQRAAAIGSGLVYGGTKENVTVRDVRTHPTVNPEMLERLLGGPGSPHGIGVKVWQLIHAVDHSKVGQAREVPSQISIEDSYIRLDTMEEVLRELRMLAKSLIKRMHLDLLEENDDDAGTPPAAEHSKECVSLGRRRWIAHPKTLRLSTRPRPPLNSDGTRARSFNRISRSAPLPSFIFSLSESVDALTERLVSEALLPMFRKLHPERSGWDLSLVNVAVTNMADAAGDSKTATGRDISNMFRNQAEVLKDVLNGDTDMPAPIRSTDGRKGSEDLLVPSQESRTGLERGEWDSDDGAEEQVSVLTCEVCGAIMPAFAMLAHQRFHELGD
ncbi:hypothetical protein H2199_000038 [Coniosporium tulheliwenetii]|uniref:Uncharacterized protein n=1 Tax=Coniosporium tulheliwenetii TaxID=3383036 RepID=A0ACC2ZP85_9PEZI|nr:hypothetical protein H2199_000038 [Cladosporium sp. JES 115]